MAYEGFGGTRIACGGSDPMDDREAVRSAIFKLRSTANRIAQLAQHVQSSVVSRQLTAAAAALLRQEAKLRASLDEASVGVDDHEAGDRASGGKGQH
ncbi:MAG: hypothetical protein ABI629_06040 [bacterium]